MAPSLPGCPQNNHSPDPGKLYFHLSITVMKFEQLSEIVSIRISYQVTTVLLVKAHLNFPLSCLDMLGYIDF